MLFALLVTSSCSKDGSKSEGVFGKAASLYDSSVLTWLPEDSLGFISWTTEGDAYRAFKRSSWGKAANDGLTETISKLSTSSSTSDVEPFVQALQSSGLLNFDPNTPDAIKEGVVFVSKGNGGPLNPFTWGIILDAADGTDLTAKLPIIEQTFTAKGFTTTPYEAPTSKGFSLKAKDSEASAIFSATKSRLVVSTKEAIITSSFSTVAPQGINRIKSSPEFSASTGSLSSKGQFVVGYLDVVPFLSAAEPALIEAAKSQGKTAEDVKIAKFPIQALAFSRSLNNTLSDVINASISPRDEDQTKIFQALVPSIAGQLTKKIPVDTAAFIGLDGASLAGIKNLLLQEMSAADRQQIPPEIALLDSVQGFGIALRNASASSPFPEVLLAVQTEKAQELLSMAKDGISMAMAVSGMPPPPWSERDLDGMKIQYFITPLGVGAYIGQDKGTLILATSERAVVDTFQVIKGKKESLDSALPPEIKAGLDKTPSLVTTYFDFSRISALIEGVQGSLAMFTGGKSLVDPSQTAAIRQMGTVAVTAHYKDKVFTVESSYQDPKPQ